MAVTARHGQIATLPFLHIIGTWGGPVTPGSPTCAPAKSWRG